MWVWACEGLCKKLNKKINLSACLGDKMCTSVSMSRIVSISECEFEWDYE